MVHRATRGGSFSFHSQGLACDIYLDANDPLDMKLGDILFRMFYLQSAYLKVDHTIWNGQIWSTVTRAEVYRQATLPPAANRGGMVGMMTSGPSDQAASAPADVRRPA